MPFYEVVKEKLPLGFNYKDQWYDEVTIREMTGGDNQIIASSESQNNPTRMFTSLLAALIVEFKNTQTGDILNKITKDMIGEMFTPDRDACWLFARKLSLGNIVKLDYRCRVCRTELEVDFDLNDIDIKRYEGDFPPNLIVPITLPQRGFIHPVDGTRHPDVLIKQLRGKDNDQVVQAAKINQAKAVSVGMFKAIEDVPGFDPKWYSVKMVDDLSQQDYKALSNELNNQTYGPRLNAELTCSGCGDDINLPLAFRMF